MWVDDGVKEWLARNHRSNIGHVLREAIAERVEELEDFYEVSARLARPHRRVSDEEIWTGLDRAD